MRKCFILMACIAIVFQTKAQIQQKLPIDPQVRFGKLDNGLTYYIRHNEYPEKRADFYIAQKVGSMQEDDSQVGLAHFLEHMAFNGTENFPGKKTMLNYLEGIGVKFGTNVNAYTSFDETVYNLSDVPVTRSTVVDSCLLILHDWSSFIALKEEQIDEERKVIKEEWRTRSGAQSRIWDKQLPVIFKGSKYADRMPIGKMEVVENFPYQTLRDYYRKWYRPDLQGIIVVGDIDAEATEAKIKSMFADIPKPVNPAKREYFPVPDNEEPIVAIATDPEAVGTQITLYMKHDILPEEFRDTPQGLITSYVKSIASAALSDRLSEIARKADAPFASSYAYDGEFFVSKTKDAWTSSATCKEGKVGESLADIVRENEKVRRFGFTDAEVERAKASILKSYENAYNNRNKQRNSFYVREYVSSFTDGEAIPGIEYEYNFAKQIMPALTSKEINAVMQSLIGDKNLVITVTGPEKDDLKYPSEEELKETLLKTKAENILPYVEILSNEPLVSKLPKPGKVVSTTTDAKFGTVVWTLSNGIKVALKKTDFKDDQILMSAAAYGGTSVASEADIFNASAASSVPALGGLGNFNAVDLRKVLSGKAANVSPFISDWTQGLNGSSSIADAETMFQLIYLHFTAPRKDEEAFASRLELIKSQIKNAETEPSTIFGDSLRSSLYGANRRMKNMKLEDAEKLDYNRIVEIYKTFFSNPGAFVFTFVGTVDEAALKPLVEQYIASLPSGDKNAKYKLFDNGIRKGKIENIFEQEMKTPKTSVFSAYSGMLKRDQRTEMSLSVLKQIFDIVYVRTVREEAGGTYGVRTGAGISRIPDGQTVLQMSFDTDPDRVDSIAPIIAREVKNIAENGPETEDFQKVKEYMAKKFHEDEKQNGYWIGTLNVRYFYGEDRHSDYLSILKALNKDDIKNVARQLVSQDNFATVIMNPKK